MRLAHVSLVVLLPLGSKLSVNIISVSIKQALRIGTILMTDLNSAVPFAEKGSAVKENIETFWFEFR